MTCSSSSTSHRSRSRDRQTRAWATWTPACAVHKCDNSASAAARRMATTNLVARRHGRVLAHQRAAFRRERGGDRIERHRELQHARGQDMGPAALPADDRTPRDPEQVGETSSASTRPRRRSAQERSRCRAWPYLTCIGPADERTPVKSPTPPITTLQHTTLTKLERFRSRILARRTIFRRPLSRDVPGHSRDTRRAVRDTLAMPFLAGIPVVRAGTPAARPGRVLPC